MKLGTQTGSLMNHLYSRMTNGQPEPEVGMGATILSWSDRYAATVTAWDAKKGILTVQRDDARRIDAHGHSEMQKYECTRNLQGPTYTFRISKNGRWNEVRFNEETRRWNRRDGYGLRIGERLEYYDFSF